MDHEKVIMLDVDKLKKEIAEGIQTTIIPAIKRLELMRFPSTSELGNEMAEDAAAAFDDIVTEPLAEIIANAIDYYVKNISIFGTIITVGSMVTQTAVIAPAPSPVTAGSIPNTLGIK